MPSIEEIHVYVVMSRGVHLINAYVRIATGETPG